MTRIAGLLATLLMAAAQAEPMYISDKLVVNVYTEADQESSKLTTLDSGDAVEVLETAEVFAHVRLPDSREGWIKSSYLSNQVPAIVRLKELEKTRSAASAAPSAQLVEELKQLKEQNVALQAELSAAKAPATKSPSPAARTETTSQSAPAHSELHVDSPPSSLHSVSWGAGFALIGGLSGFALGYQALARRIRRKYGSVKIY
jgi:SH3-like domain-containing protein